MPTSVMNELDEYAEHVPPDEENWCCAKRVLSLQRDFVDELKPMLQRRIGGRGRDCFFCRSSVVS